MSNPSLRIYTPVLLNNPPVFVADVTARAVGYRRSIRAQGGYWLGEFRINGEAAELAAWFYERLGCHFEEKSGGFLSWEGLIYEMDLTVGGTTRRRSLDLMYNYVTTNYIDNSGNVQVTAAAQAAASIARYGRREEVLLQDGIDATAAAARRDSFLAENAWPWARTVGVTGAAGEAELVVGLAGYAFTANWRFQAVGDGTTDDLSDWVREIITADCELVSPGAVSANSLQVVKQPNVRRRAWELLLELAELGDTNGAPYRIYVDNARRMNYEAVPTTPAYYLRGGEIRATAGSSGDVDPWRLRPGVVRDLDYPVRKTEHGAWLEDARDIYISEVEVSAEADPPWTLKTELFDENDILAAQAHYQAMLEGGGAPSGERESLNWKRRVGWKAGDPNWLKWEQADYTTRRRLRDEALAAKRQRAHRRG